MGEVRITGLLAGRHGDGTLQLAAAETGIALATLKAWRKVDKRFPAQKYGRPYFSVGVAEAFCALEDRDKLVSREQPWTVAEARALAASRRKPRKPRALPPGKAVAAGMEGNADGTTAPSAHGTAAPDGQDRESAQEASAPPAPTAPVPRRTRLR